MPSRWLGDLTAGQVAEISARNRASRVHRFDERRDKGGRPPGAKDAKPRAPGSGRHRQVASPGQHARQQPVLQDSGHFKGRLTHEKRRQQVLQPTEHQIQVAVVQWFDRIYAPKHDIHHRLLFAVPNSSKQRDSGRIYRWVEGLRAGVPDLFLAVPVAPFAGLFVELKRHGRRATLVQQVYHERLRLAGYAVSMCDSYEEARIHIEQYLEKRRPAD